MNHLQGFCRKYTKMIIIMWQVAGQMRVFILCSLSKPAIIFYATCVTEKKINIEFPFFLKILLFPGFFVAHSGHMSSQSSRSSALEFLIFWFSFLFTSHTPTTPKCSGIFFSVDFTHHHPWPKSKLSTTLQPSIP